MSKSDFGKSPDTIVLLSPGLNEKQIWGEKLAVRSEAKYLGIEFPDATIYQYGIEDLERIAAMKVDLLISYFTGPRPPWRIDNIAELVEGVTILKVVNHGDLLDEFAQLPVDGFITNSVAAANLLGKRRPAAYISLAVEDDYGPVPPQDRYRSDVVFLGSGGRGNKRPTTTQHYLEAAKKFDFAIWGSDWDRDYWAREYTANPQGNDWYRFCRGPLALNDIAALYSSAKIVLNFHEDSQRQWGMWNNRVFEALGCGALMICDECEGLREEFGARGAGQRPADLRLDLAHARNGDLQPLADPEIVLGLDAAALVGEVGQFDGCLAAVGAMSDRIDLDRVPVFPSDPSMDTPHDATPTCARKLAELRKHKSNGVKLGA